MSLNSWGALKFSKSLYLHCPMWSFGQLQQADGPGGWGKVVPSYKWRNRWVTGSAMFSKSWGWGNMVRIRLWSPTLLLDDLALWVLTSWLQEGPIPRDWARPWRDHVLHSFLLPGLSSLALHGNELHVTLKIYKFKLNTVSSLILPPHRQCSVVVGGQRLRECTAQASHVHHHRVLWGNDSK